MSAETTARQPKGVPVGGQFATTARAESGTALDTTRHPEHDECADACGIDVGHEGPCLDRAGGRECCDHDDVELEPVKDWGAVNLQVGSSTPWGSADHVHELGSGAVQVGTPGHGGIKLSAARNRAVPEQVRTKSGWYEEDCEAHIVAFAHPDLALESPEEAVRGMKSWFPDQYEAITGEVIAPGESFEKDERAWKADHAGDQVVISAVTSETHPGMVEVVTTTGGVRTSTAFDASRTFLVPTEEYRERRSGHGHGFVVDPTRHEDVTTPKAPKTILARVHDVQFAGMSAIGEARARKALAGRWQSNDGTVRTLAHVIAQDGISGKSSNVDAGKRTYFLSTRTHAEDSASGTYAVPKALFDAVDAPDARTARDLARDEWKLADHAVTRARQTRNMQLVRAAQEKAAAARRTYDNTLETT